MIRHAFTLIELLVVMLIMGIALFSVSTVIGERTAKGDPQTAFFEELFSEHLEWAREYGAPVAITGFKGSANILKYDGSRASIPDVTSVQSAEINGVSSPGIEYYINIYPDGFCDHFVIETDRSVIIESQPLMMTVVRSMG